MPGAVVGVDVGAPGDETTLMAHAAWAGSLNGRELLSRFSGAVSRGAAKWRIGPDDDAAATDIDSADRSLYRPTKRHTLSSGDLIRRINREAGYLGHGRIGRHKDRGRSDHR